MPKDRHVGKFLYVKLPNTTQYVWRWVIAKREDGRYIVRIPKRTLSIAQALKKYSKDFSKEGLLPVGTVFYDDIRKTRKRRHSVTVVTKN